MHLYIKILLLLSFIPVFVFSQNEKIDSCKCLLEQYKSKDTARVNKLNRLAYVVSQKEMDLALQYLNEAESLSDSLNYLKGKTESLLNKGVLYKHQDDYLKAQQYYFQALAIAQKNHDSLNVVKLLNNIGVIFIRQKDFDIGVSYLKQTLKICKKIKCRQIMASCYNNLGLAYNEQGNDSLSLIYYLKAKEIYDQLSNKYGTSVALTNIGVIFFHKKNYKEALNYHDKALEISKNINDEKGICIGYINKGEVYLDQKQYSKALYFTNKALKLADKKAFLTVQLDACKQLSDIYSKMKDYEKAYAYYVDFKRYNDSLLQVSNIRKIAQLEFQFKEQKQREIAAAELRKKETVQNMLIFGISFMAVSLIIILYLLWQKHKANKILFEQKEDIKTKNTEIIQLNDELKEANNVLYAQKTELKKALNDLKQTQLQLLQKEKMASIGILTSGIAHEINNPLNFISGSTFSIKKILTENNFIDKNIKQLLYAIETGVNRILAIVKGLNDFSSRNNSNDELCEIHSIIDNCLLMLYSKYNKRIVIEKDFADQAVVVKGNVGDLHQVFINLFLNSIDAINNKGKIFIRTKVELKNVIITISDTGVGIEEENIPKIIEPFFTTKDPGKGVGLGVSIVYSIIEQHKGSIKFTSQLNKGTTVTIQLPLYIIS